MKTDQQILQKCPSRLKDDDKRARQRYHLYQGLNTGKVEDWSHLLPHYTANAWEALRAIPRESWNMALIQLILYLLTSPKNHSGELAAKCLRRMYNGQVFNGISGEKLISPKSDIKPFQSERIKLILKSTHKLTILSRDVTVEQSFCLFPGNISSMKSASTSV